MSIVGDGFLLNDIVDKQKYNKAQTTYSVNGDGKGEGMF